MTQPNSTYPAVSKDTLLTISKKNIVPFPGLPSLLDVASEIFSKEPIKPENYQRFSAITDVNDVFLTSFGATTTNRTQKPVQKKRYFVPKSPFTASGLTQDNKEKVWYYVDEKEATQGPFSSQEMDGWYDDGFFFNELMIRLKDQGEFKKLGEVIGKPDYQHQQQQQQGYSNNPNPKPFSFSRNDSGSNNPYQNKQGRQFNTEGGQQGRNFERRPAEEKSPATTQPFSRAKREDIVSPTEVPKQIIEQEKPAETTSPVVREEVPEKKTIVQPQEEEQEEVVQEVDNKKQQAVPPAGFNDSDWVSIPSTKTKKKNKGKEQQAKPEPPKPVRTQTTAPQKPVESPKKEEKKVEPVKVEAPKVEETEAQPVEETKTAAVEEKPEKVPEVKPVETQAKPEPPKTLGVAYPFNQNIAPIVVSNKQKSKGKKAIIVNWADEDSEIVAISREQERPNEDKLSSVLDFPSLGGPIMAAATKEVPKAAGKKNKGNQNNQEDQQLKSDLLKIQQQQQKEEEEAKLQQRIKQEEERERKLKQQQKQKEEQLLAETKPVKKEAPSVTEEEFPSLGMGAPQQERPAPKKKAQPVKETKKNDKPAPAPKEKASPVKTNNPKYMEDFPTL